MLRRRSLLVLAPVLLVAACVVARDRPLVDPCPSAALLPWTADPTTAGALPVPAGAPRLRIASYNVHSGLGSRFALRRSRDAVERNLRAVAAAIADAGEPPDAIALNEVDFAARRSGGFDQAAFLAGELERRTGSTYEVASLETWRRTLPGLEVRFGNALLVRHRVVESMGCLLDDESPCVATARADDPAVVAEARGRHDAMRRRQLARIVDCDLGRPLAATSAFAAAVTNLLDVATPAQRRILATTLPGLAGVGS